MPEVCILGSRERALRAVLKVLKAVVKLLADISESVPPDAGVVKLLTNISEQVIHLTQLLEMHRYACLPLTLSSYSAWKSGTSPVFQVTAQASDRKCLDHSTTFNVVDGVLDTLYTRSEEEFKTTFENPES